MGNFVFKCSKSPLKEEDCSNNTEFKLPAIKKSSDPNPTIGSYIKDKQGNNTNCSRFHYNIENEIENAKKGLPSKTYQSNALFGNNDKIFQNNNNTKIGITNYNDNMTSDKCYYKIPNRRDILFCDCNKKFGNDVSYTLQECGDDCPKFSEWSECTKKCGGGTQTRTCSDGIIGENSQCVGDFVRECNTHNCPIDCSVSSWSPWSNCEPCYNYNKNGNNNGTRIRTRSVIIQPLHDGKPCPELEETESCKIDKDCYKNRYKTIFSEQQSNEIENHLNNIRKLL
tara:strand:+ start:920 stop:1768 length:849 start_codon:yes stop_codon:yes gene_type:complete